MSSERTIRDGSADRESIAWHALSIAEVLRQVDSTAEGLSGAEAAARLKRYGPNALQIARPISPWKILLGQLKSLVVVLLFAAAVVALVIGDLLEAAAILVVLVINTAVGFWTEWRARLAMDALRRLQVQEAVALRDGREQRVDARVLVPGDVIVLEPGAAIPADARVLSATELGINEAPLTGESLPVGKGPAAVVEQNGEEVPLAERASMVYKGTLVTTGSARAVVVATGAATEIGHLSKLVQETEAGDTPLERRLDSLGRRLVWLTLSVAALVTGLGLLRGEELWLMVETGIALAIAAVPEGLPVVATITLAVGVRRMARRQALVRRLTAVETLGSATVICTDKTGTLTAGEMTVTALAVGGEQLEVTGPGYEPVGEFRADGAAIKVTEVAGAELALRIGALANRATVRKTYEGWAVTGDPTEAALLVLARKAGLRREQLQAEYPEVAELPFSSERQLMATFHSAPDGRRVACVKGGPRRIVEQSSGELTGAGVTPLDDAGRAALLETNRGLAGRGLRVLALAYRALDEGESPGPGAVHDLVFVGFAGMQDPPAEGVRETITRFHNAGVRTVMITGDQAVTAEAVGRDLGLLRDSDETVRGRELSKLSDAQLSERVGRVSVFSRVSPEQKLRIVEALQGRGDIVGMLGDGVNDAAALKKADIGVAMGIRGTDVAKETADVVLQDDRFETVGVAVEDGRVIYDNIRKFIFYLFSCNLSEVATLLVTGLAGMPLPLMPLQILWLNLVTDVFPALALAMEPPEPDVMGRPPRDPKSAILSRWFLSSVVSFSLLITSATLAVFVWALEFRQTELSHAVTLAFMTLALAQLFHVFNARSARPVVFGGRLFRNRWVWAALALTIGLQVATVYIPLLSRVLGTHALSPHDWLVVLVAALMPLIIGQMLKPISMGSSRKRTPVSARA
ncbi:MAG: cation-transporting P-type ATPase [Gemmatimonadales bacterium]